MNMKKIACCVMLLLFLTGCGIYRVPIFSSYSDKGTVTVRKKETLYAISRKTGVPVRALIEVNHLQAPYTLSVGQKLIVPKNKIHIVKKKETLYSISKRYNMTVSELARRNGLRPPYGLSVGQKLAVSSEGVSDVYDAPKKTTKTRGKSKSSTGWTKNVVAPKKGNFAWPKKGKIISDYGYKSAGQHNDGINIAGQKGDIIKSAQAGQVVYVGNDLKGYGNLILIKHPNNWMTAYAHNQKVLVKKGATVKKGEQIATMGTSGNVKTPQLHFEIRYKTKAVDPKNYLH